jgi:hypothetical protein
LRRQFYEQNLLPLHVNKQGYKFFKP